MTKGRIDNVIIEDGITGIGDYTFYNCGILADITIPDSVTRIGKGAFKECSHLESIEIPHGVTCLEESVFQYCGLTGITIPSSVTKIEAYAIYNCNGLTSITIPDNVTRIDNYAIFGCYSLTSITISDSVTYIGNHGLGEGAKYVDVYTVKDCAADRFFKSLDNGSSQVYIMHYLDEPGGDDINAGTCGDNAIWTLTGADRKLTLTISGSGEMYDYEEDTEKKPHGIHTREESEK